MPLPPNYAALSKLFASEDAAREWLEAERWPNGPVCPHCGVEGRSYRLTAKPTSKRPVRKGVYKCQDCRQQFTVTVGTIFEDSHVALNKWLYAIHLMCSSKKGVSANQLCRTLGVQYKTAWFMAHRIRKAMEKEPAHESPKLGGIVEADETFVGGRKRVGSSGPTARGTKTIVFTLIQRDGDARSMVVNDLRGSTLQTLIRRNVTGTAHIMTDENPAYHGLEKQFASHESVTHAQDEWVRGIVHVNFSESYFSLFKRGIIGAFHHISKKHTPRYLEEFDFRWNSRKTTDAERLQLAIDGTEGKRLYYRTPKWITQGE